jgi:hypothetical protein
MMNWIWRLLAPRVDSAITMRLVTFHRALIARGQIEPISPKSNERLEARPDPIKKGGQIGE